ncbi:hotdog domain-containing protein [Rugosimonospora acidiphila]|uniref:Hotdog domain-containing protein n=1 Tax=Rugosimonospora acidiphila TaxID=556531 RepID=A0ABP9S192_9ACTN
MPPTAPAIDYGHVQPAQVYFDDLDAMGLLHHARYAMILDRALTAYWAGRGYVIGGGNMSPDSFNVVRELTIEYRAPIVAHGEVLVHLWLNHLGTTSAEYGFRILSADGGVVHAEGRRGVVKIDPSTLRPTPWTDQVRADVAELLRPAQP